MKRIRLGAILDFFGKFISLWFVVIVLFRCLKYNFINSCLISLFISISIFLIIYFFKSAFRKQRDIKNQDYKNIEILKEQFTYTSQTNIKSFLMKLYKKKFEKVLSHKCGFSYCKDNTKNLVVLYYLEPLLLENEFLNLYRKLQNTKFDNVFVMCFDYKNECQDLAKRFKSKSFQLVNLKSLYFGVLKKADAMPNFEIEKNIVPNFTFKSFLLSAFTRKKAKSYFWFGVLLFVSSFFVPMSIYYLVFSLILFSMSFVSRFIIKEKISEDNKSLW